MDTRLFKTTTSSAATASTGIAMAAAGITAGQPGERGRTIQSIAVAWHIRAGAGCLRATAEDMEITTVVTRAAGAISSNSNSPLRGTTAVAATCIGRARATTHRRLADLRGVRTPTEAVTGIARRQVTVRMAEDTNRRSPLIAEGAASVAVGIIVAVEVSRVRHRQVVHTSPVDTRRHLATTEEHRAVQTTSSRARVAIRVPVNRTRRRHRAISRVRAPTAMTAEAGLHRAAAHRATLRRRAAPQAADTEVMAGDPGRRWRSNAVKSRTPE